ncbi:MAG: TetR/AcrR family transcriptional regulator C-terminal domain-containing protein, partial [Methanomassiliicoccales archaeon]|nr:TetR/AcrR family transcriptional regulator C-terminal domain-containing protein [Methanomassiliicoccales archaeon]
QMDAGHIRQMDPVIAARALMGMVQAYFLSKDLLEGDRSNSGDEDRILRGFVSIFLEGMRVERVEA